MSNDGHPNLASPRATGGAGHSFEQHVDAAFLVLLLCGGSCPFFSDGIVDEVHFQAGHLGWRTDDLLIIVSTPAGVPCKVAIQVKQSFSLSAENEDCKQTFLRAYNDYIDSAIFNTTQDRVGLITGLESKKLLTGLRSLLDVARASLSATDMVARLQKQSYIGKVPFNYFKIIKGVLATEHSAITDDEVRGFLRVFDFVSLDLLNSSSSTLALLHSLLRSTASDPASAVDTWNALLGLASEGSGRADSFNRSQLPSGLTEKHTSLGATHTSALQRLRRDSEIVVASTSHRLSNGHVIPRTGLVDTILERIETDQIVVVTGEAGAGKSGAVSLAVESLSTNSVCICFRSEAFGRVHINEALFTQGLTLDMLMQYLAMHPRVFIWVESVERLLERQDREAFKDLLIALKNRPNLHVILTCRSYSADTVRTAFLEPVGLVCDPIDVGTLADQELDDVRQQCAALERPLSDQRMRKLLGNPFLLNQATLLSWAEGAGSLPANEREFRQKVWRERIRNESRQEDASVPGQRAETLIGIARERAVALSPYVDSTNYDANSVELLCRDSILSRKRHTSPMVTPAHDVYEDWALIQWIEMCWDRHSPDHNTFFEELGTFPAIRRAYRKWLIEIITAQVEPCELILENVPSDPGVATYWQDDTILAILESPTAGEFLKSNAGVLRDDSLPLLRRIIHLLRIVCRVPIPYSKLGLSSEGHWLLPKGPVWGIAAGIIEAVLPELGKEDLPLILGFMEDWGSIPTHWVAYPPGSVSIAKILQYFLPMTEGYDRKDNENRGRLLKLWCRIPAADKEGFQNLIRSELDSRRFHNEGLVGLLMEGMHSAATARDLPDLYLTICEKYFSLSQPVEDALQPEDSGYHSSTEMEKTFGLSSRLRHRTFPPSAYHGPLWMLYKHHPEKALDLSLRILNRCCEVYAHPENRYRRIEAPELVSIRLRDGRPKDVFGNSRLWLLYRSLSVGPNALQSILMALERWLYEGGSQEHVELKAIADKIAEQTNNVMPLSVLSGIITAFPKLATKSTIPIFTQRNFYFWDLQRTVRDPGGISTVLTAFPNLGNPLKKIFTDERKESDSWPHRKKSLEDTTRELQTIEYRTEVWEIIDYHYSSLPPEDEQDETDKLWRLLLHRTDLRGYKFTGEEAEGGFLVSPGPPASDIQEIVDAREQDPGNFLRYSALAMYGRVLFEGDRSSNLEPPPWRELLNQAIAHWSEDRLTEIRAKEGIGDEGPLSDDRMESTNALAGPGYVAAVCVRDHWEELSQDEKDWCAEVVTKLVSRHAASSWWSIASDRNLMCASRPCAYVLSFLVATCEDENKKAGLISILGKAILHPIIEVCVWAAQGCARFLSSEDESLVINCLKAQFAFSASWQEYLNRQRETPWQERDQELKSEQVWTELRIEAREVISESEDYAVDLRGLSLMNLDSSSLIIAANLLSYGSNTEAADWIRRELAAYLVQLWETDPELPENRRESDPHGRRSRDFETIHFIENRVAGHIVLSSTGDELASALVTYRKFNPEMMADFVQQLVFAQDGNEKSASFWFAWQELADRFVEETSTERLENRYYDDEKLARALLLSDHWKPEARDWAPLHGEEHRITQLFEQLPRTETTTSAFLRFLAKIGRCAILSSIPVLAAKLHGDNAADLLSEQGRADLDSFLSEIVRGGITTARKDPAIRSSTIELLDLGIACGSSLCYRMRDDFLTPWRAVDD